MTNTTTLLDRNHRFGDTFAAAEPPVLPKLRAVIPSHADSRVNPTPAFGLELGDVVVVRNTGGQVAQGAEEEIAALAFMVANMDGAEPGRFKLVLMQHNQCGDERFSDPGFQSPLKERLGVDLAPVAITDHEQSLRDGVQRLREATEIPDHIFAPQYI